MQVGKINPRRYEVEICVKFGCKYNQIPHPLEEKSPTHRPWSPRPSYQIGKIRKRKINFNVKTKWKMAFLQLKKKEIRMFQTWKIYDKRKFNH